MEIISRQRKHRIRRKKFEHLLEKLIRRYRLRNAGVTLAFVGTKAIKTLKRRFLKKNGATDVLSFPIRERDSEGKYYLGDIVISVPQAFRQSLSQKHSLERELEILTIHGFLHLMDYDHGAERISEEEDRVRRLLLKD